MHSEGAKYEHALTNIEVNELSKIFKVKNYVGCVADNTIPYLDNKQCCIVNYQSDYEGGTHWTSLRRYGKYLIHYDSLGFPVDEPIIKYAKKFVLTILTKQIRIQQDGSYYCGHHSIYFLKIVNTPEDINKYYDNFDKSLKNNDLKISNIFDI